MINKLTHFTITVRDIDEALAFYTENLGFQVRMDQKFQGFRWTTVGLEGQDVELVLHKPVAHPGIAEEEVQAQLALVGKNPMICVASKDCKASVEKLKANGVAILREPEQMPWGVQAVFADLYGNQFCMVQTPEAA